MPPQVGLVVFGDGRTCSGSPPVSLHGDGPDNIIGSPDSGGTYGRVFPEFFSKGV